ncbi:MAG TPA: PEP/pyruvate-binding domain-containing protein [Candidatus Methanoperedens sp.]|nr:PEP/pyruvate-binding domain-containing protein [Candidatus Methanoperedens sp.]
MNTSDEKYFMNWDEAFNSTAAQVGGKGYNMARLHRYGFQVSAGGVLISRVYRDFLESNGLSDHINAVASIKAESVLNRRKHENFTDTADESPKNDRWRGCFYL